MNFRKTIKKGQIFIPLIITLVAISCNNQENPPKTRTLDFGSFTIETPFTWTKVNAERVDSYAGGILIDSGHLASFELGIYSSDLHGYSVLGTDDKKYASEPSIDFASPNEGIAFFEKNKNCKFYTDTVDSRLARFIVPINSGIGVTGLYIDSLWNTDDGKVVFSIQANNLNAGDERLLVEAFKTLKFKKTEK